MADFADVARARASYKVFEGALRAGREIMKRAGVPDPPPIPEFDAVFRKLDAASKEALYVELRPVEAVEPKEAIRIWTPLVKRAFGGKSGG